MIKKASVRVCAALLALMLIAASLMTAFADIQSHMDDTAAVFTNPEQYSSIESKLEQSSEKTGWNILFHSVSKGYKGDSLKNYADNYLNQNGLSGNALLYVYDSVSKKSKILTAGEVDKYFDHTDRLDDMVDKLEPYTKKGDIAGAVMKFGDEAVAVYNMGKPVLFVESLKHFGVIAGLIGVAAGVIFFFVTKSRYKNMGKSGTYDLAANSSANLEDVEDTFVTQHTTVRTIQKSNSSGGGSSGGSTSSGHASRDF